MAEADVPAVEPLVRTPEEEAEDDAFYALYGPWAALTPDGVAELLAGFDRPWWIVGGWAIDAATGVRREHEDVDVSMLASDVPALYDHLEGRWHLWNQVEGVLTPFSAKRRAALDPTGQIWVRRDAGSPWVVDIILIPDRDGLWVSKRDAEHVATVEEITWVHTDGVRYQRPEIVLLYKALKARPKDQRDLRTAWPVLDEAARRWLAHQIERLYPDHPWLTFLSRLDDRVRPGDGPAGTPS
jgi:hypothetical protein